jgi:hypothetical protein
LANHTIGNKRGSVRGAPPDVYIPFSDFSSGNEDPFSEAAEIFKSFLLMAIASILVVFFTLILWAIGILPDGFIDY